MAGVMSLVATHELIVHLTGRERVSWSGALGVPRFELVGGTGARIGGVVPREVPLRTRIAWALRDRAPSRSIDYEVSGAVGERLGTILIRGQSWWVPLAGYRATVLGVDGLPLAGAVTHAHGTYRLRDAPGREVARLRRDHQDRAALTWVLAVTGASGQGYGTVTEPLVIASRPSTLAPRTYPLRFDPQAPPAVRIATMAAVLLRLSNG
jgi:hypothetical protein